jgi:putative methyltransferase (TIGR04325 family)
MRLLIHGMVGFRRPFNTLEEASDAASLFYSEGHATRENANRHIALALKPRPSDYAALFHLRSILPGVKHVFDLGGNVGNLFYCYSDYLELPTTLTWMIYDLPAMLSMGQELARERNETRLRFTDSFYDADGADLLIASGSLHYFAKPLGAMLADLEVKPKYVLINRTPLVEGRPTATVQEAEHLLAACNLFNREELLRDFQILGYEAADSWLAEELSLQIPCYPEL